MNVMLYWSLRLSGEFPGYSFLVSLVGIGLYLHARYRWQHSQPHRLCWGTSNVSGYIKACKLEVCIIHPLSMIDPVRVPRVAKTFSLSLPDSQSLGKEVFYYMYISSHFEYQMFLIGIYRQMKKLPGAGVAFWTDRPGMDPRLFCSVGEGDCCSVGVFKCCCVFCRVDID